MQVESVRVRHTDLDAFIRALLCAKGMGADDAAIAAEVFVWADLHGVSSHGVAWLPMTVQLIEEGSLNVRARPHLTIDMPARVVMEANSAAGSIAMMQATRIACDRAALAGVCIASVRNCTHTGPIGRYATLAAHSGCAAIILAAGPPFMAYHGSRVASLSTSPIAMAVPGPGGEPIVLDIATSMIPFSKLRQARLTGTPVPEGAALAVDGKPTTDPAQAFVPLPIGGHKGSGLSLMTELLTSVLVGNAILTDHLPSTGTHRHTQNALIVTMKVSAYRPDEAFARDVAELAAVIKGLPRADQATEIRLPGEQRARVARVRQAYGIPISGPVWAALVNIARIAMIEPPEVLKP